MNIDSECELRFIDCLLRELEGEAPVPELTGRRRMVPAVAPRQRRPFAAMAVALAAAAAVLAIAWLQRVPAGEAADASAAPVQDPSPQATPSQLVLALADPERRAAAAKALQRAGRAAIPALVAVLEAEPPPADALRGAVLDVLAAMPAAADAALPAIAAIVDHAAVDAELLRAAFRAAAELAPFAGDEARALARRAMLSLAFLRDGPRGAIVGGLGAAPAAAGKGGPLPMREMARFLHREQLGERLANLPEQAATDTAIAALQDDSPYVRELAATLLGERSGEAVQTALRAALTARHPMDVTARWRLEVAAGDFTYRIDHDDAIHLAAARSLVRVAPGTPAAAVAQSILLRLGTRDERRAAVAAVCRPDLAEADAALVAKALAEALRQDDEFVVREAVTAIGVVGHTAPATLEALRALTLDRDKQLAARARATLRALGQYGR